MLVSFKMLSFLGFSTNRSIPPTNRSIIESGEKLHQSDHPIRYTPESALHLETYASMSRGFFGEIKVMVLVVVVVYNCV